MTSSGYNNLPKDTVPMKKMMMDEENDDGDNRNQHIYPHHINSDDHHSATIPLHQHENGDGDAECGEEDELKFAQFHPVEGDENTERGNWSHKFDFILSLLGYAVGLSNIWRFPYLCYRNGGGAFLVPYWFFMCIAGVPLFFMEAAIGQFTAKSAVSMWSVLPLLKGAGYATVVVTMIIATYYNVVMGYVVFFFVQSFTTGPLPWASCGNYWNTPNCLNYNNETLLDQFNQFRAYEETCNKAGVCNETLPGKEFESQFGNKTFKSPSDEYFHNRVLQISSGLDEPGGLVWELAVCLIPVWLTTGLCLVKGVKSVGKVVYFTATFPYLILLILLIKGVTLPGAWDGIKFYIIPKFDRLLDPKVWCDAAFQVFFSLGPGWGGIVTMGSYNKFNNNCYKDGIVVPFLMGLTSVFAGFVVFSTIGFMAHTVGRPVEDVVEHGPGLAFIMYPEVVTKLPMSQLWSALFFFMLFTVGLDSMFVMIETAVTAVWDELPPKYKINRGIILLVSCIAMYFLGLPCATRGGMYLFQLIDTYSATYTVITVSILEVLTIAWFYGAERFMDDIAFMIGYKPPQIVWSIIWRFGTSGMAIGIFIVAMVQYSPLERYLEYDYPNWSKLLGWAFCLASLLWIPIWAVGRFIMSPGKTLAEKWEESTSPTQAWGPALEGHKREWKAYSKAPMYGRNFFYRLRHPNQA